MTAAAGGHKIKQTNVTKKKKQKRGKDERRFPVKSRVEFSGGSCFPEVKEPKSANRKTLQSRICIPANETLRSTLH